MRWKALPAINFDGFGVKTSSFMDMTPLDRSYVMCTVMSFEHLSDHVKLVWSHISCHCFSILQLWAHQFCLALRALFWGCWQFLNDVSHLPVVHSLKAWLLARRRFTCQSKHRNRLAGFSACVAYSTSNSTDWVPLLLPHQWDGAFYRCKCCG